MEDFPDHMLRIAILERNGFRLEIIQTEGSQSPARRLKEKGVRFQLEPLKDEKNGSKSFIVLDPDGNWIQLTQRAGA